MHNKTKKLKVTDLKGGGFIFCLLDNDGVTIIKEWFEQDKKLGIQTCRNWLDSKFGGGGEWML